MSSNSILQKSVPKLFFKYVSFNMIAMLGMSLYFLADTYFIANGVGKNGLIALNLILPAFSVVLGTGAMIGIGGGALYSIAVGEKKHQKCRQIFSHCIIMIIILGISFTLIGVILSDKIVMLLGANENSLEMAQTYFRTIISFSIAFIASSAISSFVRNDGNPRLAMIASSIGSLSNIIFDWVLIYPCKLGMFGAALATGFSPIITLIILSPYFIKNKERFLPTLDGFSFKTIGLIISTGFSSFINELSSGIVILVFNMSLLKYVGDIGVAAYGIIANIALVCTAIFNGIGQGTQPLFSVFYGAKETNKVKKSIRYALCLSFIIGSCFYLTGLLLAPQITSLFNNENNLQLQQIAVNGIHLYFLTYFFSGINIVLVSFFASVSKSKPAFLISCLRGLIIIIPAILLLPILMGTNGIWLSIPLTEFITMVIGLIFVIRFLSNYIQKTNYVKI